MDLIIENQSISTKKVHPKQSGKRLEWVDYARGLAILLVVYRHTMVGLQRSSVEVPAFLYNIQEFLVNVRMPVFFVLSGIFLSRSLLSRSEITVIRKKAKTLLYPYLLWAVILISFQILLSDYTNSNRTARDYLYIFEQPRELDHMWYLLALFNTSVLLILGSGYLLKRPVIHLLAAIGLHIAHFWVREYSLISDICYYYVFLAVGVHASQLISELDKKGNSFLIKLLLITTPFFIAGQLFWLNNIDDSYSPANFLFLIPFLAAILIACIMFYGVCRLIFNSGKMRWLNILGRSSLHIYILHILIISSFRIFCLRIAGIDNVYFLIGGSLLLGVLIPVLIYRMSKGNSLQYLFSLEKPRHQNG